MESKDTAIKKVKGFSSAYPHICNLKLLPNTDGTWITIQDDVGTSMTIKLSDLNDCGYYMAIKALKKEPCEDAVSRADAIEVVDHMLMGERNHKIVALEELKQLPSVQPHPKIGHWIKTKEQDDAEPLILWKCSECLTVQRLKTNYCPECGAKMKDGD